MHGTFSTACGSEAYPTFPYRPRPKAGKGSPGLQRKRHTRATPDLIAWRGSLGLSARAIVVITHFMCVIAASTLSEERVGAQIAPPPQSIDRFTSFIVEASTRFAVPARRISAIIQIESAGDEHAISPRGAMDLMQLMPGTWAELSVRYQLGLDPFDPKDNILAATAYLRELRDRFGSAGFLAAYHAGPARYEQHLTTGQPLPPETTAYVAAVTRLLGDGEGEHIVFRTKRAVPWREAPLFVERVNAR